MSTGEIANKQNNQSSSIADRKLEVKDFRQDLEMEANTDVVDSNEINNKMTNNNECIDSTIKKSEKEVDYTKNKEHYKNLNKIISLLNSSSRDKALVYLFRNREKINGLANLLWYTPGVITVFLQEIIKMYAVINEKVLKKEDILNCYNIISLFQLLVMDSEIKFLVVKCKFLLYLIK